MTRRGKHGAFVGESFSPEPIDRAILKRLPADGARIGSYLWDAKTTAALAKELGEGVSSQIVSGRVRLMEGHGLTRARKVSGRNRLGWQRTEAGRKLVERK